MMIHAGFILPFLLLATADNNVRKQRTPGEVDGGYYSSYPKGGTSNLSSLDSSPDFWDNTADFLEIPTTMENIGAILRIVIFVLLPLLGIIAACTYGFKGIRGGDGQASGGSSGSDTSSGGKKKTGEQNVLNPYVGGLLGAALVVLSFYGCALMIYYYRRR